MNKYFLSLSLIALLLSGCASFGPTVRIETPKPMDDFVVLCQWHKSGMITHGGGRNRSDQKIFIVKNGEEVDCGMSIWGGNPSMSWMHPLYTKGDERSEKETNGVLVITPVTKLQYLNKQKERFLSGHWDKHKNPGFEYAQNLIGCGFPHQYFDYYSEVKRVEKEYFKELYNDAIFECYNKTVPILKEYRASAYRNLPDADNYMEGVWAHEQWDKWNK